MDCHPPLIPAHEAPERIVIASRESALALWQAHYIRDRLQELYPHCDIRILGLTTRGDQLLSMPLSAVGGKGLFIKELEEALAAGSADIAVHSMKDVPMDLPVGFALAAITQREDPRDAFVSNHYFDLASLPPGGRVGTSSLRRESQVRAKFPGLQVLPLRGNVQTRLRKLDEGQFDAIILAAAGLKRLGLGARIRALLAPEDSLPAVGQGALGIEIRSGRPELARWMAPLNHADTACCVTAERALSRALAGSCQVPLGGYAEIRKKRLLLRGFVASPDGARLIAAEQEADTDDPQALGLAVAQRLRAGGAEEILARIAAQQS